MQTAPRDHTASVYQPGRQAGRQVMKWTAPLPSDCVRRIVLGSEYAFQSQYRNIYNL